MHFELFKESLTNLNKPQPLYFTSHANFRSSNMEIKKWINDGEKGQLLITTSQFLKGFQCDALIDFTLKEQPELYSRATTQILRVSWDHQSKSKILFPFIGKYNHHKKYWNLVIQISSAMIHWPYSFSVTVCMYFKSLFYYEIFPFFRFIVKKT